MGFFKIEIQMKIEMMFAAAVCTTTALTSRGEVDPDAEVSPVDQLIMKGIEKIEDDTRVDMQKILEDMIVAEVKEADWGREQILTGLRIACIAQFGHGSDNCLYGLLDEDVEDFMEEYEELINLGGLYANIL